MKININIIILYNIFVLSLRIKTQQNNMKSNKQNTEDELNKIREVIEFWGISQAALAAKMWMLPGTFSNKMRTNHSTKFTPEEIEQLKAVLSDLANTLKYKLKIKTI